MEDIEYLHEATYSPEDDKLRLYLGCWLGADDYKEVTDMGFRNAPKQGCQFAVWTPAREDFCLEMAGEIEAEGTTLAERAAAKAERLDDLSSKRARQANSFHGAANAISERFAYGQPILVGHHSERRARRDQARMESAMNNAVRCADAVDYWSSRASSVERHANRKNDDGVRARRIKTLLAELRGYQRDINESNKCIQLWEELEAEKGLPGFDAKVMTCVGFGNMSPYLKLDGEDSYESAYWLLRNGKITHEEVLEKSLEHHYRMVEGQYKYRCIRHLLNRLAYERGELGEVERFGGNLTPVIIQTFLREHGADKPKASKTQKGFKVVSAVELPLHIAEGCEIELSVDEWLDKMQACGYEVPAPKPKKPGIVNFKALSVIVQRFGNKHQYPQIRLTQKEYMAIRDDYRGSMLSACGTFKVRVCIDPDNQRFNGSWYCVFVEDNKEHPAPKSPAVVLNVEEGAA